MRSSLVINNALLRKIIFIIFVSVCSCLSSVVLADESFSNIQVEAFKKSSQASQGSDAASRTLFSGNVRSKMVFGDRGEGHLY